VTERSTGRPPTLRARCSLMSATRFATVGEVTAELQFQGTDLLATDELSYCRGTAEPVAEVDDLPGVDAGRVLDDVLSIAATLPEPVTQENHALGPDELAKLFVPARNDKLAVSHFKGMVLSSSLAEGEHAQVYAKSDFMLAQLGFSKTANLFLDVTTGLDVQLVVMFLDHQDQRIHHETLSAHTSHELAIPLETANVRLGFRVAGPGTATVRAVLLGNANANEPTRVLGRHELLVLTNIYPAADDLYCNAFVHRRVVDYAARGVRADVCCLRPALSLRYHEFEGVDVVRGGKAILEGMLALHRHRTVLVHFLDEAMWTVLLPHLDELSVLVWVHGSEIQPWHRRTFDISSDAELATAKVASEARMKFWRSVLTTPHRNLKLVFVSKYFADEVQEDLGLRLPPESYEIIHNLIDTELFTYQRKPVEQRKRILTIRPFASRKYANDLSVQAIVELSKKPFFNDLEFRVIGDGKLFDETVAPLRGFRNVIIEPRFMTQAEIAALHKDYGVFLSPTRMDAQGVSRDEAMSSGLVPITSNVAAIPEFVDEDCGFMAPLDDAAGLAAAIEILYHDPARFERMSAAAAARVPSPEWRRANHRS
jgi:glycosyltransferase involved in cell wall biosynthesis